MLIRGKAVVVRREREEPCGKAKWLTELEPVSCCGITVSEPVWDGLDGEGHGFERVSR